MRHSNGITQMKTAFAAVPKKRLSQIVLALPALVFLALALRGIYSDYEHIRLEKHRLEARTAVADGTFVEVHDLISAKSGSRIPQGTIVFNTASGQTVKFQSVDANAKVGMKIPVRYDPRQPDNYAIGDVFFGFSDLIFNNGPFLAIGVFFLFLVLRVGYS